MQFRLRAATKWLRRYNKIGFLGEIGGARNQQCYDALTNTFKFMEENSDVWLGW